MKPTRFAFAVPLLLALGACDEETDRFEHLKKLRTLGVATDPVVGQPSTADAPQLMTLTFYASVPLGATATAETFVDEQARYAAPLPMTLDPTTETYEDHNTLRIYSIKGTVAIPTADQLPIPADPGFLRVRYGLKLTQGGEAETIVGNFLVYPAGASELAWTAPSVDIAAPGAGATVGVGAELKATLVNTIGENMRIGWFVNDGKVKNRRARETTWEEPPAGPSTVIVTARGMKSGAFTMKALDVTVQ